MSVEVKKGLRNSILLTTFMYGLETYTLIRQYPSAIISFLRSCKKVNRENNKGHCNEISFLLKIEELQI